MGDPAGLNADTMSLPGIGLHHEQQGLSDQITEANGMLSVRVNAFRFGGHVVETTYQSQDDVESRQLAARETVGLPFQWSQPWFPRFVAGLDALRVSGTFVNDQWVETAGTPPTEALGPRVRPRSGYVQYSDGSRERVFSPISQGVGLPSGNSGPIQERRTSSFGRWEMTPIYRTVHVELPEPGLVEFVDRTELDHWSREGIHTHFANGDCRRVCDATEIEDQFGNGTRIDYYDGSSIPRVAERYRRDAAGQVTVTERVHFYLRGDYEGDVPPLGEPQERTRQPLGTVPAMYLRGPLGTDYNGNGGHLDHPKPSWPTADEWLIGAIRYPAPSSDPLSLDETWHVTRFEYERSQHVTDKDGAQIDPNGAFDWCQLRRVHFEGRTYGFQYAGNPRYLGSDAGVWRLGHGVLGRIASIDLPQGTIRYSWDEFETIDFQGVAVPFTGVSERIQQDVSVLGGEPIPAPAHVWRLRYLPTTRGGDAQVDGEPGSSSRERFHTSVVEHPSGLSTVRHFFPLARDGWPQAARSGLLAEERLYPQTVLPPNGTIQSTIRPTTIRRFGYATFVAGLERVTFDSRVPASDRWAGQDGVGWVALPAFETQTNQELHPDVAAACCSRARAGTALWFCQGTSEQATPTCFAGDTPLAEGVACEPDDPAARCYTAGFAGRSYSCLDQVPHYPEGEAQCPLGMDVVEQCPSELPSCGDSALTSNLAGSTVVTLWRENRPGNFLLGSFSGSGRGDYDTFSNAPFQRTFSTDGAVVVRAPSFCDGRCEVDAEGGHGVECSTNWNCTQDVLEASPTSSEAGVEVRFRYLVENLATTYEEVGLTGLITEERTCALGTSCLSNNDVLRHVQHDYDYLSHQYPHTDAPGDRSGRALGRRTYTRTSLVGQEQESAEEFVVYYGDGDAPLQLAGNIAERSYRVSSNEYRRVRVAYDQGGASAGSGEPTAQWTIAPGGEAMPTMTASRNAWGLAETLTDELGQHQRNCYDRRGRVTAVFRGSSAPLQACPSSEDEAPAADVRVYYDEVGQSVRTLQRVRFQNSVHTAASMVFYDGLGRTLQTRGQRLVGGQALTTCESASYFAHSHSESEITQPYLCSGPYNVFSDYRLAPDGFNGLARSRTAYDVYGRPVRSERVSSDGRVFGATNTEYGDLAEALPLTDRVTTGPNGAVTLERFDAFGRSVLRILPDGAEIAVEYDGLGRPLRTTHPDGLTSERRYDSFSRVVWERTPERGVSTARYNRVSQLVHATDANGGVLEYDYDSLGRLVGRYQVSGINRELQAGFVYDVYPDNSPITVRESSRGRLTRALSPAGVVDYGYNERGLVVEQVSRIGTLAPKTLRLEVDTAGAVRRRSYQQGQADGSELWMDVDDNGSPFRLRQNDTLLFQVDRDAFGRVTRRHLLPQHPANEVQDFFYDDWGRLAQMNLPENLGTDAFAFRLAYEEPNVAPARQDGVVTEVEWARIGGVRSLYAYEYDSRAHLVNGDFRVWHDGWQQPAQNPEAYDFHAQYDRMGAIRTIQQQMEVPVSPTTFHYEQTSRRLMSTSGGHPSQFAHDSAGNTTHNFAWGENSLLTYNLEQRPETIEDNLHRTVFTYDHTGQVVRTVRFERQAPCPNESRGGREATDVGCFVAIRDQIMIRDPSGNIVAEYENGAIHRHEIPAVGYFVPSGQGTVPGGYYLRITDHVGSTRVIKHESGAIVHATDYGPYGQPLQGAGVHSNGEFAVDAWDQFATYPRVSHAGVHDVFVAGGRRLYLPELGQFLSPDLATSDSTRTAYAYASGSPATLVDPTGLYSIAPSGFRGFAADGAAPFPVPTLGGIPNRGSAFFSSDADGPGDGETWTDAMIEELIKKLGWVIDVIFDREAGEQTTELSYVNGTRLEWDGQTTFGGDRQRAVLGADFHGGSGLDFSHMYFGAGENDTTNPLEQGSEIQLGASYTVGPLRALDSDDNVMEISLVRFPIRIPSVASLEGQLHLLSDGQGHLGLKSRIELAVGGTGAGLLSDRLQSVTRGRAPAGDTEAMITSMVETLNSVSDRVFILEGPSALFRRRAWNW